MTTTLDVLLADPDRLAILADALEEAGCPTELSVTDYTPPENLYGEKWYSPRTKLVPHPVLAHLRGPGPHVRGCWAVDLILGRS